uniref:Uncharacterized protein n=1 Tax=Avena sativa TaxID=4498 RepID=A0ACD5ZGE4_AVESA
MVMRGGNVVKTSAVILLVACLASLVQIQQAQAAHCCCLVPLLPAYLACRPFGTVPTCCPYCTGYMSNGYCDYGYTQPPVRGAPETDYSKTVADYCKMGCTASACDKISPSVVGGTDGGKDIKERCISACHDLCTKDNAEILKLHGA